jgi:cbb3-type cytochrome oxidase cytochrome c subunit
MHLLVIISSSGRAVVMRRGAFCCHSRQTRVVGSEK